MIRTNPLRTLLHCAVISAVTVTTACSGCGDEETAGTTRPDPVVDMEGNSEVDMTEEPEPDMEVAPPTADIYPAYASIVVRPSRALYGVGDEAEIAALITGTNEQPIVGAEVMWTVTPTGAASRGEGVSWTFEQQGRVTFEVCSVEPDFDGEPVCATRDFYVDESPPSIEITSPTPGTQIDGSMQTTIAVAGTLTDDGPTDDLSVFVNDRAAALDEQGNFTAEVTPEFGINHIEVVATDGRNSNVATADLDVMWAPAYDPGVMAMDRAGSRYDDGLMVRLGQRFFDDGVPPVTTMEGASFTEDLADVLTLLVRFIDFTAIIPDPVVSSSDLTVRITDVDLGRPTLTLAVTDDGLELFLGADSVTITTNGMLNLVDTSLNLTGDITAGVSVVADINVAKPSPQDPFEVTIDTIDVSLERATSNFQDAQADAIFELAQSALRTQIETVLIDALRTSFINTLPSLLTDTLNSLEEAIASQTFPLDPGFGDPVDVTFEGSVETLDQAALQHLTMRVQTRLTASTMNTKTSLGAPLMQPLDQSEAPFLENSRLEIGLRLGLLNGLLHGLWEAGLLDLDATMFLPEDFQSLVSDAQLNAVLPPMVRPAVKGEGFDLILELGQVELVMTSPMFNQTVTYGVSLSAGISAGVVDNALSIEISETPMVRSWVIDTDDGAPAKLDADVLKGLLEGQLWTELTSALAEGLSLPLPLIEIPELSMYAPALSSFTLTVEQVRPVVIRDGFIMVDSRLRGTLPAPMMMP